MDSSINPSIDADLAAPSDSLGVERPISKITLLLKQLEESSGGPVTDEEAVKQDCLVESRLGIASSLFTALRYKHAATAAHSLRVAIGCSSWGMALGLPEKELDDLEVAALLHDVGKIGVPEQVLLKPRSLSPEESDLMDRHRTIGQAILKSCGSTAAILDTVRYATAWYDGSKPGFDRDGKNLPDAARMLAIVDASDAMTTDHVYRPAMSRERATQELFANAGTQFDPDLVKQFVEIHQNKHGGWQAGLARRWLSSLQSDVNSRWRLGETQAGADDLVPYDLFHHKLLDNMHDAVVLIDSNMQVISWNRGAERLTGISAETMLQRTCSPDLIGLQDTKKRPVSEDDCPVRYAIRSGVQCLRRLRVTSRNGSHVAVDLHVIPVTASNGTTYGAAMILHDASSQISLEQRCQNLHERATVDGLSQVANRAEFDRVHRLFVEAHLERQLPCSMYICDIDRFKSVNDTYGHPAGDAIIRSFAQLLKSFCRSGDLVARYGGEEFVVLCADCTNAVADSRANEVRKAFAMLPHVELGGACITASFGVTEIQPGDTPETMLARADRALLAAKDGGRNRVVQLGTGVGGEANPERRSWWWTRSRKPDVLVEQNLITAVPLKIAIEKLRGFVADHAAEIISIEQEQVQLRIHARPRETSRRGTDRPVPFIIDLEFSEDRSGMAATGGEKGGEKAKEKQGAAFSKTKVRVSIRLHKNRDRRRRDADAQARKLLASFRSYLMAFEETGRREEKTRTSRKSEPRVAPSRREHEEETRTTGDDPGVPQHNSAIQSTTE